MIDVDQVLDEPTERIRRRRREPWPVVRCTCTRQHSCPMHARVPTPYQSARRGRVVRDEREP